MRGAFRLIVGSTPGLEVVGEGENGAEAVSLVRSLVRDLAPDVVLMDIGMPVMDRLGATRAIAALGDKNPLERAAGARPWGESTP